MDKNLNRECDRYEKEIILEKYKTALKKTQFINEIKGGLGEEIKKNPNKIKIIKKTWSQKLRIFFVKIFKNF